MTWTTSLPFHRFEKSAEKVIVEDGHGPPVVSPCARLLQRPSGRYWTT